jgi:tetraacyldisaccharide 4'-kinase
MRFLLLYPFALLWSLIIRFRNLLFDNGILSSKSFPFPVIVIGNLSLGGTGKTQMMKWLTTRLQHHQDLFVLSRGYGRKSKGLKEVNLQENADIFGDEPSMLKRLFPDLPIFVGEDRVNALTKISKSFSKPIALLDDAFQHRKLKPGFSVLLFNFQELDQMFLFPAGRLRDNLYRANQADVIIITKISGKLDEAAQQKIRAKLKLRADKKVFFTKLKYALPYSIFNEKNNIPIENQKWIVFTGIAKPEDMINYLNSSGKVIKHFNFNDHHNYSVKELQSIKEYFDNIAQEDIKIITTEKDAARIRNTSLLKVIENLPIYILPVEIDFFEEKEAHLLIENIEQYVKRNL